MGRVLITCEFSGIVRQAFAAQGWDAYSCDILPTEQPGQAAQRQAVGAVVRELIYLGDHTRARVSVAGNDDFVLKIPNSLRGARLHVGERITVGWASYDCKALDAGPPAASSPAGGR